MGPVNKYIGLYIVRDQNRGEMWVHQAPYVSKLLEKYNISDESCPDTPLPYHFILETPQEYAERLNAQRERKLHARASSQTHQIDLTRDHSDATAAVSCING